MYRCLESRLKIPADASSLPWNEYKCLQECTGACGMQGHFPFTLPPPQSKVPDTLTLEISEERQDTLTARYFYRV